MLRRHRTATPFAPTDLSGLSLWLKADAGVSTTPEQFISQIIISGAGTTTSNGTYTRASGGLTTFNGPNGNYINYISGVEWALFDTQLYNPNNEDYGNEAYYTEDFAYWYIAGANLGESPAPSGTITNSPTGINLVTVWADQSGNGNNFTPASGTVVKSNNIIGSNPAVLFDGGSLFGNDIVTAKTIYAVIKTLAISAEQYAAILEVTGGSLYSAISGTQWGSYYESESSSGQTIPTETASIIATLSDDGINYELRRDGQQVVSGTGTGFTSRSAAYLGSDSSAGQPANVYISEIVVYNRVLTTPERQQVEAYLNAKYAIY